MSHRRAVAFLLLSAAYAGCSPSPQVETRTFELKYLEDKTAEALVEPYVYRERADGAGTSSVVDGKLTVRETPDNLARIAQVLEEFDRPKPMVRLRFQIIEADGAETVDPAIAEVESALRELFRFEGYRLLDEVLIQGTEGNGTAQEFRSEDYGPWSIETFIENVRTDSEGGSVQLRVGFTVAGRMMLHTSVRVRTGQTAVLGRSPAQLQDKTLVLAVRPELVDVE